MAIVARIIGLAFLTGALCVGLAYALFGRYADWSGVSILLGSAGGIIGAVAGAAREIVTAQHLQQAGGSNDGSGQSTPSGHG